MTHTMAKNFSSRARDVGVDVVVPVYRGLAETRACIESVLASRQRAEFELIVIDDCAPEPDLVRWLAGMAELGKFTLLKNEYNQGFVRTVNRSMALHPDNDVVLLNSDTVVANDWLDRLIECAYADARTATVTPFSNNAVICSYPGFCEDNHLPVGLEVAALDSIFANANHGRTVEIPTGVGFCLYLRRDAVDSVGLFDAETFGLGYGEENDFCQRAIKLGWKNVLAANVFVWHAGDVSFGAAQHSRKLRAMELLLKLHPNYTEDVRKFIAADPARPFRVQVDFCRLATGRLPVILAISHSRGGGTQKHIDDLAALMVGKAHCLLLRPIPGDWIELVWNQPGEALKLNFDIRADYDLLLNTLNALGVCRVHYHTLVDMPPELRGIAQDLNVPYDFTIHDYYLVCPQIHLNYASLPRYCGEQGEAQCKACLRNSLGLQRVDIVTWRSHNADILKGAGRVFAPSRDVAKRLARYFPQVAITTAFHPESSAGFPLPPQRPRLAATSPLRIFVLGALSEIKGADLLEACATDAAKRNLPLRFELIGYGYRRLKTAPEASLLVHGSYDDDELQNLLKHHAPDLIWLPTLSPETYSYTLSAALTATLPVAVPDIGAFAERIAGRPWSWIYDWQFAPVEMNDWLVSLRKRCFVGGIEFDSPVSGWAMPDLSFSYREHYVRPAGVKGRAEISHVHFAAVIEKVCARARRGPQPLGFFTDRALRFFHIVKHHALLSKVIRRVPAHHQQKIKNFLLNADRGLRR